MRPCDSSHIPRPAPHPCRALLLICLVLASACNLAPPSPTPIPTVDRPRVEILSPPSGQEVIEGTAFDIDIIASDHSQGIARIELYVDDLLLNASEPAAGPIPRYRVVMNWFAQGQGRHVFKAIALRADGVPSSEHRIVLNVIPRR